METRRILGMESHSQRMSQSLYPGTRDQDLQRIDEALKDYEVVAGARINWDKSVGLQLGSCRREADRCRPIVSLVSDTRSGKSTWSLVWSRSLDREELVQGYR